MWLTNLLTVPSTALRTLERLYGTVLGLSFPTASLFGWSLHTRLHYLAIGAPLSHGYLDSILMHPPSYLENNLANIFATAVLKEPSFQQIMVGGSNFGELCGAVTVFFTVNHIPTCVPLLFFSAFSHRHCQTDTVPSFGRNHAFDHLVPTILPPASKSAHRSMEDGGYLHPHFLRLGSR